MTCRYCGNEIRDGAKFCPHCGAAAGAESPVWEAAPQAGPEAPVGGGKKKTGLIAGAVVAAVAVIALVAVFAGGLFSNPKKQVEAAFVKSAAAYAQVEKALNLPDTAQWQKDRQIDQEITLRLNSVNSGLIGYDLSGLSDLVLAMSATYNGQERYMAFELMGNWAGEDLLTMMLAAEDDKLYFVCDQLTGDNCYGVNTETLGADLAEMTGDNSMEDLSFNLFDLVDMALERVDQEKLEQDLKAANKALWDAAQVKKTGSKTLSVNGTDTKTAAYRVTIPQQALEDYADALVEVISSMSYYDLYEELYRAMGMPQDQIDGIMDALEELDPYGELADDLKDAIAEIGDLTLNVFLSGGYVSAVQYEGYLFDDDTFVKISVFLGGGEEYVDDLRLELKVDDQFIIVDSEGDHSLKSGAFTDETVIKGHFPMVTSELSLDPTQEEDNFHWRLEADGSGLLFALDMAGDMDWGHDHLSLDLEEISLQTTGMELCNLSLRYAADCDLSSPWRMDNVKIITQMDQLELMMAALEVQQKAEAWTGRMEELFASRLPEELLYATTY